MALVNYSVHNYTSNKTVLSWSIMSVEGVVTVQQFYYEKLACKLLEQEEFHLNSAVVAKSKDSFDTIEMSLYLECAVQLFGACFGTTCTVCTSIVSNSKWFQCVMPLNC